MSNRATPPITLIDQFTAGCERIETLAGLLEAVGQDEPVDPKVVRGTGVLVREEVQRLRQTVKALQG